MCPTAEGKKLFLYLVLYSNKIFKITAWEYAQNMLGENRFQLQVLWLLLSSLCAVVVFIAKGETWGKVHNQPLCRIFEKQRYLYLLWMATLDGSWEAWLHRGGVVWPPNRLFNCPFLAPGHTCFFSPASTELQSEDIKQKKYFWSFWGVCHLCVSPSRD